MTKGVALAAFMASISVLTSSVFGIAMISRSGLMASVSGGMKDSPIIDGQVPEIVSAMVSSTDQAPMVLTGTSTDKAPTNQNDFLLERTEHNALSFIGRNADENEDEISASINLQAPQLSTDFDAGGPYGGSDCFEGSCLIHFEINTDDATLIFFRWDFNNDSVWDTPWMTEKSYDKMFYDNYYGMVKAEGWDGVSMASRIITGYNLYPSNNYYWNFNGPSVLGWRFRVNATIDATDLYMFFYYQLTTYRVRIWDYHTNSLLGSCEIIGRKPFSWEKCALSAMIHLVISNEYMIEADTKSGVTSWLLFNSPGVPWDVVEYEGMYYGYSPGMMPEYSFGGGTTYVPMIDFKWRQTFIEPLTKQDLALTEVRNVPPMPFNISADPESAFEGSPVRFTAQFNDPGLEDDWEYRWSFDNSTWTPWRDVKKFSGGARVLILHSLDAQITEFKKDIVSECGSFCLGVDVYDIGESGSSESLTLDGLVTYDVLYVETNYPVKDPTLIGNLLADYMDQKGSEGSGGVVMGNGPYIANSPWEIRGRYFEDGYNPVGKAGYSFGDLRLGVIHVPGHPILDGVTNLTSYMHIDATVLTDGATRVADWSNGKIAIATMPNPVIGNDARSVAMPWSAWYNCKGDCVRATVNALRWASRQSDPMPLTMPVKLPWTSHTYGDDDPVTASPWDNSTVLVQVKDDDHLKINGFDTPVYWQNFSEGCNQFLFPSGWVNDPYYGWRCMYSSELGSNAAAFWFYYNDDNTSLLSSPSIDLSAYDFGKVEWRQLWWADYPGGSQDGYVEASADDGQTYPMLLKEFHHGQPANEKAVYSADVPFSSNQIKLRYRIDSDSDWAWIVDDIKISGVSGYVEWGLGNTSGVINVSNVEPSVIGGPSSDTAYAGVPYDFTGLSISDPALWQATEWFAYRFDFGDGTPAQWIFKGSLTPPKQDVLIIHSLCMVGDSCVDLMNLVGMLNKMDLVGTVETYNFFEKLAAPSLDYMKEFDIVMFASSNAYLNYPPFDAARIVIGNNMASYLDLHAGGIVTWMATYDISPYYGDVFSLLGRYIDQDYGPFEKGEWAEGSAYFPPRIEIPGHPVMNGLNPYETDLVRGGMLHSGDLATTSGALRLASWNDEGMAVGVKDFNSDGRRSCAIGAYAGGYGGPNASLLLRNCIGWVIGGLPSPEMPMVTHTWMSPGTYNVDISIIDDDMGWTWDSLNDIPVSDPVYPQTIAHRYIQIDVQS